MCWIDWRKHNWNFLCLISILLPFLRNLKILFLEESTVDEKDGEWLHELALNNTVLETLNFYMTDLEKVKFQDIELVAKSCSSLNSVKISDCEILNLLGFFRAAYALEEFGGGSFNDQPEKYSIVSFPPKLTSLGLTYMGKNEMPIVFSFGSNLKKLDLLYALLDMEDHCVLIQRCPNLEILEVEYKILLWVLSYYFSFVNTCIHMHGYSYSFFLFASVIRVSHNVIYGKTCIYVVLLLR